MAPPHKLRWYGMAGSSGLLWMGMALKDCSKASDFSLDCSSPKWKIPVAQRYEPQQFGFSTMKIFIVENHLDTLESMTSFFEDCGHEVKSAATVEDALKQVPAEQPDVLFCDIGLPDGTGWELKQSLQLPNHIFAVAMSGFGMNADSARSREAGFRYHLLKPFSVAELNQILAEAEAEKAGENRP